MTTTTATKEPPDDDQHHYELAPPSPAATLSDQSLLPSSPPPRPTAAQRLLARYEQQKPLSQRENPLTHASLLSTLLTLYLQPLISLGAAKPLETTDLWPVCASDACDAVSARFMREYTASRSGASTTSMAPLLSAFFRVFWYDLVVAAANFLVYTLVLALQSYVAQAILDYLNDRDNIFGIGNGYVLVAMMTTTSVVAVMCLNHGFFVCTRFGSNFRSAVMDAVYQKSLRLSSTARQKYTTGEIVTLMSVDAERLFNAVNEGFWVAISPFGFLVTIVLIAFLFDVWAALSGAALLVVILWLSFRQARLIGALQGELLRAVDQRVKVMSEALQGIRVVKFYAWEDSITRRVRKIRDVEVALYRRFHTLQIVNIALLFLTPTLLSGVTFGVYVIMHGDVSVTDAFTLIAMVNVMRAAVGFFPRSIAAVSQARIAVKRVDQFLTSDELHERGDRDTSDLAVGPPGSISVRQASFRWSVEDTEDRDTSDTTKSETQVTVAATETQSFRLQDVDVEIKPGSLVMIVGTVGAGKSSFLNALLGEMTREDGSVHVNGSISYVAQESWIRNASVKDNILFESPLDAARYEQVLDATQLTQDLHALSHGDQTEIGERGINLSGGQKARVAIARAVYRSQYDILILDDPLSAVDPHVAHAIFDHCIVGLAKTKTRLLVLNSHYDLLVHADQILVVEDGRLTGDCSYEEIMTQFPDLIVKTKQQTEVEEDTIDEHVGVVSRHATEAPGKASATKVKVGTSREAEFKQPTAVSGADDPTKLVQAEDRIKGKVTGLIYKTYFDEAGLNGYVMLALLLFIYGISQGVRTLVDWWQGHWAKNMVRDGIDPSYSNLAFGMWYLGFIVLCCILMVVRGLLLVEACIRSSRNMHDELLQRVLKAPITRYFDVTPVGRILNRFSNDLDQVDASLPQQYQLTLQNVALCVGAFAVSAASSYWIALSYIPTIVAFVAVGRYFKKTSREVKRLEGITRTPIFNLFSETLTGLHTIRAFKMQDTFIRLNKQVVDANTTAYFTYWCTGRWLAARLDLISVVIIFIISLYLVATKGQISPVVSGISLTYSLMLTSVVQSIVRYADRLDNTMTSVERLLHFRTIPSEETEDETKSLAPINSHAWPSRGEITFKGLYLKYRPELPLVLQGVDMTVLAGEKVGICGRTGAGKSSLMVALFRVCEFESGTIVIDGVDIQSVRLRDLRQSLAIIPQDPVLYSGSLRENLDPFGDYADDVIWSVLKQVHLYETVVKWNAGLEYTISERGDNLSVGQRQLLCIGRALLKDSKIVVLDEATANVDTATDALIQTTIRDAFQSKTVLTIAHRIDTILHCDKIAVMDAGRVAEFGAPSELLAKRESIFSSLASRSALSPST